MKSLSAKKAPELANAVKEAASEPAKAVSKAVRQARTDGFNSCESCRMSP